MAILTSLLMTGCDDSKNVEDNNVQESQNIEQEKDNLNSEILNQTFFERIIEARDYMNQGDSLGIESLGYISAEHFVGNTSLEKKENYYVMKLQIYSSKLYDKEEIENAYNLAQTNGKYTFEEYTFYKNNEPEITSGDGYSEDTLSYIKEEVLPGLKENGFIAKTNDNNIVIFMTTPNDTTKYCVADVMIAGASGFMRTELEKELEVILLPTDIVSINVNGNMNYYIEDISVEELYNQAINGEEVIINGENLLKYDLLNLGDSRNRFGEYQNAVRFEDSSLIIYYTVDGI